MKKIAILQSNYIPWKGYFDLINSVDEFVILDTVQYTKNDWRNRNKIKTKQGLKWLTIPVNQKNRLSKPINEISISDLNWMDSHVNLLKINYKKSEFFDEVITFVENIYIKTKGIVKLSEINELFIRELCSVLNIKTKIIRAEQFGELNQTPNDRLIDICNKVCATSYLSGPSAKNYLDSNLFLDKGIMVEWMEYSGYPEYNQLYGEFIHEVSILDLLFNVGLENAYKYISKSTS